MLQLQWRAQTAWPGARRMGGGCGGPADVVGLKLTKNSDRRPTHVGEAALGASRLFPWCRRPRAWLQVAPAALCDGRLTPPPLAETPMRSVYAHCPTWLCPSATLHATTPVVAPVIVKRSRGRRSHCSRRCLPDGSAGPGCRRRHSSQPSTSRRSAQPVTPHGSPAHNDAPLERTQSQSRHHGRPTGLLLLS